MVLAIVLEFDSESVCSNPEVVHDTGRPSRQLDLSTEPSDHAHKVSRHSPFPPCFQQLEGESSLSPLNRRASPQNNLETVRVRQFRAPLFEGRESERFDDLGLDESRTDHAENHGGPSSFRSNPATETLCKGKIHFFKTSEDVEKTFKRMEDQLLGGPGDVSSRPVSSTSTAFSSRPGSSSSSSCFSNGDRH